MSQPYVIRGSLTREIDNRSSPVRQFLDERFVGGLKDVQRAFREGKPPMVVASAPQAEANPGTVGGAADWLLRFMVCPDPIADLAVAGASHLGPGMQIAVAEVARMLGARASSERESGFAGPVAGSSVDAELLARGCWALALATEAFRSAQAAAMGPLMLSLWVPGWPQINGAWCRHASPGSRRIRTRRLRSRQRTPGRIPPGFVSGNAVVAGR